MLPEEQARVDVDEQLTKAGWYVCDRKDIDMVNHQGNAVREVIMKADHVRADYLLYVDKKVVGVIEAKPVGTTLSSVGIRPKQDQRIFGLAVKKKRRC
jgi:type I restriction enzyme R subunit